MSNPQKKFFKNRDQGEVFHVTPPLTLFGKFLFNDMNIKLKYHRYKKFLVGELIVFTKK